MSHWATVGRVAAGTWVANVVAGGVVVTTIRDKLKFIDSQGNTRIPSKSEAFVEGLSLGTVTCPLMVVAAVLLPLARKTD